MCMLLHHHYKHENLGDQKASDIDGLAQILLQAMEYVFALIDNHGGNWFGLVFVLDADELSNLLLKIEEKLPIFPWNKWTI